MEEVLEMAMPTGRFSMTPLKLTCWRQLYVKRTHGPLWQLKRPCNLLPPVQSRWLGRVPCCYKYTHLLFLGVLMEMCLPSIDRCLGGSSIYLHTCQLSVSTSIELGRWQVHLYILTSQTFPPKRRWCCVLCCTGCCSCFLQPCFWGWWRVSSGFKRSSWTSTYFNQMVQSSLASH